MAAYVALRLRDAERNMEAMQKEHYDIIDRNVQRLILETAYASFPDHPPFRTFSRLLNKLED